MIIRYKSYKSLVITLLVFLAVFIIIPNLFNNEERNAFSDKVRLENARNNYSINQLADSARIIPGIYYKSSRFKNWFLGVSYRDLWEQEIKVPVLYLESAKNKLTPVAFTGGLQTIGIKVRDTLGQLWSVRSVNKDQAVALPNYLRVTALRSLFRDRACSMDPYGSLASAKFSQALGLHSTEPTLYLFPYNDKLGKYNTRMAGRLVMLQRRWDVGVHYNGKEKITILDTEQALTMFRNKRASIDTSLYLRNRLFDMLISDWDRHNGNWKWLLKNRAGVPVLEPVAVDRDMAFYNFGDGVINHIARFIDKRFQSFTPQFNGIEGLMKQSIHLDKAFLGSIDKQLFLKEAKYIQVSFHRSLIEEAFKTYPKSAFSKIGKSHQHILTKRLSQLPNAAMEFHKLINKDHN